LPPIDTPPLLRRDAVPLLMLRAATPPSVYCRVTSPRVAMRTCRGAVVDAVPTAASAAPQITSCAAVAACRAHEHAAFDFAASLPMSAYEDISRAMPDAAAFSPPSRMAECRAGMPLPPCP